MILSEYLKGENMRSGNTPGKSHGANRKRRNRSKGHEGGKQQGRQLDYLAEARQKYQKERTDSSKNNSKGRLKWTPPRCPSEPLPALACPICGKPIKEAASAVNDRVSGAAAHFECVRERVCAEEKLNQGEVIAYIGGGRFGVVEFAGPSSRLFKIKKIIVWEAQETRAEWRANIANHFSLT
jgi:hypothetical protein